MAEFSRMKSTFMFETPILDRRQPISSLSKRRKLTWSNRIPLIFFGLLLITLLVRIAAMLIVCVVIHELGHLLAGLVVRWEFRAFLAGPFAIWRDADGFHLRLVPRRVIEGGSVLMVPKRTKWSRGSEFIVVAGGPIFTALVFIPVITLPSSGLTLSLAVANGLVALGSLLPLVLAGQATDAVHLIRIIRARAESFEVIGKIWALDHAGILPCSWPSELVNGLTVAADDLACSHLARQYRYVYLRECRSRSAAAAALESILAHITEIPPHERRRYFCEAAFFQAVFGNSSVLAREWLKEARAQESVPSEDCWDAYPLAAIAVAEGDRTAACALLSNVIAVLDRERSQSGCVAALRARLLTLLS